MGPPPASPPARYGIAGERPRGAPAGGLGHHPPGGASQRGVATQPPQRLLVLPPSPLRRVGPEQPPGPRGWLWRNLRLRLLLSAAARRRGRLGRLSKESCSGAGPAAPPRPAPPQDARESGAEFWPGRAEATVDSRAGFRLFPKRPRPGQACLGQMSASSLAKRVGFLLRRPQRGRRAGRGRQGRLPQAPAPPFQVVSAAFSA